MVGARVPVADYVRRPEVQQHGGGEGVWKGENGNQFARKSTDFLINIDVTYVSNVQYVLFKQENANAIGDLVEGKLSEKNTRVSKRKSFKT